MLSRYSESDLNKAKLTVDSIVEVLDQLTEWNCKIASAEDYYVSSQGMQLLAANCTLLTALGEGINRINRALPDLLSTCFPEVPWHAIVGMRNNIAHGYFELDADVVFDAIVNDIPPLLDVMMELRIILNN